MVSKEAPQRGKEMKTVVLLSGGIDSSVLTYALVSEYEVWPLFINYGQRHLREIDAANAVCVARGLWLSERLKFVDLSGLGKIIECGLHGQRLIPDGPYTEETIDACVSPNRNMILLAVAAGYAQSIGAEHVAYGAHTNDAVVYSDCRPEFVASVRETILLGTGSKVALLAPFIGWTKTMIVKFGAGLTVPFAKTWSCYKGGLHHCGKCPTCLDRKEAFRLAGLEDPTHYEDSDVLTFEMKGQW